MAGGECEACGKRVSSPALETVDPITVDLANQAADGPVVGFRMLFGSNDLQKEMAMHFPNFQCILDHRHLESHFLSL